VEADRAPRRKRGGPCGCAGWAGTRDRVNAGEPVVTRSRQPPRSNRCAWPEARTGGGVPVRGPVQKRAWAREYRSAGGAPRRHRRETFRRAGKPRLAGGRSSSSATSGSVNQSAYLR
jgi:hypothetical protein